MVERVLVEIGKRLRAVQGDCNGVARHGDGFAVLIADFRPETLAWAGAFDIDPASPPGLARLANALAELAARPLRIDGHPLVLAGQVGIAPPPTAGSDPQALLAAAAAAAGGGRAGPSPSAR